MRAFTNILDRVGTVLSRTRTVAIIILAGGLVVTMVRNGGNKTELAHLLETTTGLNFENDVLHNHVHVRDSVIDHHEQYIDNLKGAINRSEGRVSALVGQYAQLYDEFTSIADSVTSVPPDSSYTFLQAIAYPDTGPKRYPFSAEQVRAIHITHLEHKTIGKLNTSLRGRVGELGNQLALQDSVMLTREVMVANLLQTQTDLEQIIDNKDMVINEQTKHIKKATGRTRFYQIVGAVVVVVLAAIAAGGS